MAECIDRLVTSIKQSTTSLVLFVYDDGGWAYETVETPLTHWRDGTAHGISVIYTLAPRDDRIGISFTVPWHVVQKAAPSTGHCVYAVTLFSVERTEAMLKAGDVVSPLPRLAEKAKEVRGKTRVPLDALTKGRIPVYVGKTSKGMANRISQHYASACKGSRTPFHKVLSGGDLYEPMMPRVHLIDWADTEDRAYDLEERYIRENAEHGGETLMPLNVIASRDAIRQLREEHPELWNPARAEQAEELLEAKRLAASENWDDPIYAESVICNNDRNFNAIEVRQIRMMSRIGMPAARIARTLGASKQRVMALLAGRTYGRVL